MQKYQKKQIQKNTLDTSTILNMRNATGSDVKNLIELICRQVFEKTNVTLQVEKEYVGWEQWLWNKQ